MIQKTFDADNGKTLIMKGLNPIQFCWSIFLFLLIFHVCHEVSFLMVFVFWLIGIQIHITIMQFWIKLWHKTKEYFGLRTAVVEISINQ